MYVVAEYMWSTAPVNVCSLFTPFCPRRPSNPSPALTGHPHPSALCPRLEQRPLPQPPGEVPRRRSAPGDGARPVGPERQPVDQAARRQPPLRSAAAPHHGRDRAPSAWGVALAVRGARAGPPSVRVRVEEERAEWRRVEGFPVQEERARRVPIPPDLAPRDHGEADGAAQACVFPARVVGSVLAWWCPSQTCLLVAGVCVITRRRHAWAAPVIISMEMKRRRAVWSCVGRLGWRMVEYEVGRIAELREPWLGHWRGIKGCISSYVFRAGRLGRSVTYCVTKLCDSNEHGTQRIKSCVSDDSTRRGCAVRQYHGKALYSKYPQSNVYTEYLLQTFDGCLLKSNR
jgi:hypothetical protein